MLTVPSASCWVTPHPSQTSCLHLWSFKVCSKHLLKSGPMVSVLAQSPPTVPHVAQ